MGSKPRISRITNFYWFSKWSNLCYRCGHSWQRGQNVTALQSDSTSENDFSTNVRLYILSLILQMEWNSWKETQNSTVEIRSPKMYTMEPWNSSKTPIVDSVDNTDTSGDSYNFFVDYLGAIMQKNVPILESFHTYLRNGRGVKTFIETSIM